MKKIIIILALATMTAGAASAQDKAARFERFTTETLPGLNSYFASASLTATGQLALAAKQDYFALEKEKKTKILEKVTAAWKEDLVLVQFETRRELWGWDETTAGPVMMDEWNINPEPVVAQPVFPESNISKHPMFFYLGSVGQMDSFKNINGALSGRVGFFLLRDRWDLAATLAEQISGNYESEEMNMQTSIGIMSKVYYPLKTANISPNAGAEIAVTIPKGGGMTLTPSFILGVSWFMGVGSLDLGLQFGSNTSLMVGYTVVPKMKSKK